MADTIQDSFSPWRPRLLAAGAMALLLGWLHLNGGYWEIRYGAYREAFGDLRMWGGLYFLAGLVMVVPSNWSGHADWNYRWFIVQSAVCCIFSAWLSTMLLLTVWETARLGLTPGGVAYLPLPVYLFMTTIGDVWDSEVERSRRRLARLGVPVPADGG